MAAPDPAKQAEEARLWIAKADEDVAPVRLLLPHPQLHGVAAFHCQQAAEKLMKAALVAAARPVRKTHDLDVLAGEVTAACPELARCGTLYSEDMQHGRVIDGVRIVNRFEEAGSG